MDITKAVTAILSAETVPAAFDVFHAELSSRPEEQEAIHALRLCLNSVIVRKGLEDRLMMAQLRLAVAARERQEASRGGVNASNAPQASVAPVEAVAVGPDLP